MMHYKYDRNETKVACPKCGRPMSPELLRCAFCGERLREFLPIPCKTCGAQVPVRNAYLASRSDEGFLYCSSCSTILTWSVYSRDFDRIIGKSKMPSTLTEDERRTVEGSIIDCPFGGRFLFDNPLRCPVCGGVFAEPASKTENAVIMDKEISERARRIWK